MWLMTRVGIRELKLHMSALLRRAAAGEVIDVTEYGRPMVRLVPALDIEPLPPAPGLPPASELLARLRAHER
jgi:prevent-host-death family protein